MSRQHWSVVECDEQNEYSTREILQQSGSLVCSSQLYEIGVSTVPEDLHGDMLIQTVSFMNRDDEYNCICYERISSFNIS